MAIVSSELEYFKAKTITDTGTNGGRMSKDKYISGQQANVFPHVFSAERTAGSTKYRKVFCKVSNDDDLTAFSAKYWLDKITKADDWVIMHIGTQRDTQADITGSERKYGCGTLNTAVSAGATSLIVDTEDSSLVSGNDQIIKTGDTIRITDKLTPDSGTGNEEMATVSNVTASGTQLTLTLSAGLTFGYSAYDSNTGAGGRIMSVYEPGDVKTSFDNWSENSTSGTYDESTYPPDLDNIGTVEETWTITFSDATTFSCSGDSLGNVGSGTINSDFSPTNGDFSKPYFTLDKDGWGGTWANGETITFQTHPAAVPVWEKRVVPANCGSMTNNGTTLVSDCETA